MPRFAYRCLAVIMSGLLAGALLAGCEKKSPARAARWHSTTCWFHNDTKLRIDCGLLTVPLHHDRPGSPSIELAVEVIHSPNPHPQPDPVVVLAGGPGGTLTGNGNATTTGYAPMHLLTGSQPDRDLILLDQRGVGHSRPSLDCAPIADLKSGLACRDQLTARGVDLSAYTTEENAADVAELGPTLGYRQVNLFGSSYGSLLALAVLRDHPQGIRSATLASPLPAQVSFLTDLPANTARAFQTLFDNCARDPRCAATYPRLARDFSAAGDRLDARPRQLTMRVNGAAQTWRLDGHLLVNLLSSGLAMSKIAILPRAIHHAATGASLADWAQVITDGLADNLGSSVGMAQSVLCADEVPFADRQRARALDAAHPEQRHMFLQPDWWFDLCAHWPTGPVNRAGHTPVRSDIPTLIVTGQYDPTTPPAYGRVAAATLTRGYFTEFPGLGHIPDNPCVQSVEARFLHQPLQRPDTSCAERTTAIAWKTG